MADRRLQVFHAVAHHRSFTRAAESLFMTQPAVSFQVKQLEDHFNTRLLDRQGANVSLTAAGQIVLEYADRILGLSSELDERVGEMTGRAGGPLLVGATASVAESLLPAIMGEFGMRFPLVRVRLEVDHAGIIQEHVAGQRLDLGVVESTKLLAGLDEDVVGTEEFVGVCAPGHALAGVGVLTPAALATQAYIARESGSVTREIADQWMHSGVAEGQRHEPLMELAALEALKGVVAAGVGFSLLARSSVVRDLDAGRLVELSLQPRLTRRVLIVYRRDRYRSRLVSGFVDFARRRLPGKVA